MEPLSKRERELVELGASVENSSVPCTACHVREALKNGNSEEQNSDAIDGRNTVETRSIFQQREAGR